MASFRRRHRATSIEAAADTRSGRLNSRFRRVRIADGDTKRLPAALEALVLLVILVLGIAAVTGLVAFIVPVATVTMVPAQEPRAETITVTAARTSKRPTTATRPCRPAALASAPRSRERFLTTGAGTAPEGSRRGFGSIH
ncbi:MAG: hypothetical protein R2844_11865 [Caldilineales bacterium]